MGGEKVVGGRMVGSVDSDGRGVLGRGMTCVELKSGALVGEVHKIGFACGTRSLQTCCAV